jgi:hypothetical protein
MNTAYSTRMQHLQQFCGSAARMKGGMDVGKHNITDQLFSLRDENLDLKKKLSGKDDRAKQYLLSELGC